MLNETELQIMCKKIRQTLGISQKKLAERLGTTQTEISFIERGFIPPNEEKIEAIESIYNELEDCLEKG